MPRNYLIFGATSDLAAAFVDALGADVNVTLVARNQARLSQLVARLDRPAQEYAFDQLDGEAVANFIKDQKREGVRYDGVLCAAGSHEILPLRLYSSSRMQEIFDDNFMTTFNVLRSISVILNQGAAVVLTSSAVTQRGAAAVSGYAASKAAIEALARSAALELAPKKIRVNAVAPGVFKSKMSDKFFRALNQEQLDALVSSHPLGIGTPADVANCIKFLLGPESSWITGQTLIVDGGYSING